MILTNRQPFSLIEEDMTQFMKTKIPPSLQDDILQIYHLSKSSLNQPSLKYPPTSSLFHTRKSSTQESTLEKVTTRGSASLKSASDISEYLLSIRRKNFLYKSDSLLSKAYEILGYEQPSQLFNKQVSLTSFVKVILELS